jgi:hypothetical protein
MGAPDVMSDAGVRPSVAGATPPVGAQDCGELGALLVDDLCAVFAGAALAVTQDPTSEICGGEGRAASPGPEICGAAAKAGNGRPTEPCRKGTNSAQAAEADEFSSDIDE